MIVATILMVILIVSTKHRLFVETKSEFTYTLDDGYPIGTKLFGGIAGVDVDRNGNVIIFHRGSHIWDSSTFSQDNVYLQNRDSPIPEETVVTINPRNKKIINTWGSDLFYMPHGLSLDHSGNNLWLTDVALHQIFKYPINGSSQLMVIGSAFAPGNDDSHFCKPTSVADTGEYIFVADGYCNSRVVMFSADGSYIGEFGQSSEAKLLASSSGQPTFNVPHKITYSKETKMLCVADRENGRIQCFSFEPISDKKDQFNERLILNGAVKPKFVIADPQFNGRVFSLDYSPIRGGIIVAVSGQNSYRFNKSPIGFVYNVTTGQLLSKFSPPGGQTFGMAHDLAITGDEADSLYVVDISPVNLWKFSRPVPQIKRSKTEDISKMAGDGLNRAMELINQKSHNSNVVWYIFIVSLIVTILVIISKIRRLSRYSSNNSFASLYSNSYSASLNSLFGTNKYSRRPTTTSSSFLGTLFSRRSFFNLIDHQNQHQNEFSRIPMEESDNSDDDKSDSDVEEFNINKANTSIKINV